MATSAVSDVPLYTTNDAKRERDRVDVREGITIPVGEDHQGMLTWEEEEQLLRVLASARRSFEDDPFAADRARVVHSAALRRLRNKAQLFPTTTSDLFRTRLTHSMEVSQIAQALAKKAKSEVGLDLSLELIDMAGLAHDIGHPPFGRAGERALNEWMKDAGGFEGNAQNLRVLAVLEKKPQGLNLTYRSLAAVLKSDEVLGSEARKGYYSSERELVRRIREHVLGKDAVAGTLRTIECSIMDTADIIAYVTSDLEDSLKAGFVSLMDMHGCSDELADAIRDKINNDEEAKQLHPYDSSRVKTVLRTITITGLSFVPSSDIDKSLPAKPSVKGRAEKLARNSRWRTAFATHLARVFMSGVSFRVNSAQPCLSTVLWDSTVLELVMVLKHFTFFFVIKNPRIQESESNGTRIVSELFRMLWADDEGSCLPPNWKLIFAETMAPVIEMRKTLDSVRMSAGEQIESNEVDVHETRLKQLEAAAKRVICDFVSGMTDIHAVEFYNRLSAPPQTGTTLS